MGEQQSDSVEVYASNEELSQASGVGDHAQHQTGQAVRVGDHDQYQADVAYSGQEDCGGEHVQHQADVAGLKDQYLAVEVNLDLDARSKKPPEHTKTVFCLTSDEGVAAEDVRTLASEKIRVVPAEIGEL